MPSESSSKITCPNAEELRRLLRSKLPQDKQEHITAHLDACTGCQSKLELLADGDLDISGTVKHIDQNEPPKNSAYWRAFDDIGGNLTGTFNAIDTTTSSSSRLDFLRPLKLPGKIGRLGDFQVIRELGRGGMGIVLQAFDPNLEREVAVKVLSPELANNELARQRFCREARAAAAVTHENIVAVHQVSDDEASGLPYFVMQLVLGETLEQRIRREGKLSVDAVTRISWQAAQGLSAAHAAGLIHRDIKPGNILLEAGTDKAKLTDFGLARAAEDLKLTRTGFVAGTPLYMAPEQAKGDDVDARADLFALGAVMYEALAGRPPFDGKTPLAVLRRVADEAHPRLSRINPDVPDWLEDTIDELLEKDPERRMQTASQLANVLAAHFSGEACPVPASPVDCTVARTASNIVSTRPKSRLAFTIALGLPFLLGIGLGMVVGWESKPKTIVETPVAINSDHRQSTTASELNGPDSIKMFRAGDGAVSSIAIAGDADTIVAGVEDGSFIIWSLASGRQLIQQPNAHEAPIWAVDISNDGKTVITASDDGLVKVWDVSAAAIVTATLSNGDAVRSAALDPSGGKVVTGDRAGKVKIWTISTGKTSHDFDQGGVINAVAFDSHGLTVAAASSNKSAMLYDIPTGRKRLSFTQHNGAIYSIAFAPEGDWVATASWDRTVKVWESGSGNLIHTIAAEEGVSSVTFSCCGKILATAGQDGSVKVWNAETGMLLQTFRRHQGWVQAAKFMPQGTVLVTGGRDGTVRAWNVK